MPREINGKIYFSLAEAAEKLLVPLGVMRRWMRDGELHITILDIFRDGNLLYISQRSLQRVFNIELAKDGDQHALPSSLSGSSGIDKSKQFYSCFISYSHADKAFAFQLHSALQRDGIRCWLDDKELLPGDVIADGIDSGIRLWDKLLLCCSKHSLWFHCEVRF